MVNRIRIGLGQMTSSSAERGRARVDLSYQATHYSSIPETWQKLEGTRKERKRIKTTPNQNEGQSYWHRSLLQPQGLQILTVCG